ncbi:MAG: NAD(P)-dependent oxidoreductase [Moraxella osloensis]
MLAQSDVVPTLSIDGANAALVNANTIAKMTKKPLIINVARGDGVVDSRGGG